MAIGTSARTADNVSIGIVEDISEHKRAEQAQAHLAAIVDSSDDAIIAKDLDGTITSWNRGAETIYGYSADEVVGQSISILIPPHQVDEIPGMLERIKRGEKIHNYENARIRRDGTSIDVSLTISPVKDERGRVIGAATIARDISERKRAEQAQAHLAAIVDSSDDAIIAKDLDGTITSWNRGAETIYGYSADEVVGQSISILIPPHQVDKIPGVLERIKRGEKIHNYENARIRRDGTSIDVSLTISPVKDERCRVIGAATIARDISELKQAQREADRLKEEFFALVSHDLRTPLASVKGYSDLLLTGEGGDLTDRQRLFLEVTARNSTRLERLVGDLLVAAQIEAGAFAIEMGPVDLRRVLTESVDAAKPRAEENDIELTLEASPVPECSGDGDRLAQLFDNLISNAIKYTPEGGRVEARLHGKNGHVLIEIEDSGIGIATAEQEFLFDRFFRASTANAAAIPGVGLGLTISKAITEAHSGQLGVESEEGVGTTFRVEFPLGDRVQ